MNRLITLFFALLLSISCIAQGKLIIKSRVVDSKTRNDIPGATVQLLSSDSTVINTVVANNHWTRDDQEGYSATFEFNLPREKAKYIIRASYLGYKTECIDFSIGDLGKREYVREIPAIALRVEANMLKAVNVEGSKVKFYHKGDTVVYNADAFVLAEGTMLDALVRQMPGVEIKSNGKIYHNGKFVENLLLNGKDFFKGNQEVLLENLPSYTVKQVKIYDKNGKKSDFLGRKVLDDNAYVMDVNLKKEYSVGLMANLETGVGTSKRYLGRLFAMRYTDHSRLSFYGSVNNLNDNRNPGRDTDWEPEQMSYGDNKEKLGGFDYAVSDRNNKFDLNGNVQASYSNLNVSTNTDRVNFLSQGNTYDYERQDECIKNLQINTNHQLNFRFNKVNVFMQPMLKFEKQDNRLSYISGSFADMQLGVNREELNQIYSLEKYDEVRKSLISRYKKEKLDKWSQFASSLFASITFKLKNSVDYISLETKLSHESRKGDMFNRYSINHGPEQKIAKMASQYFRNRPDYKSSFGGGISYNYCLNQAMELSMYYGYEYKNMKQQSSLYRMDLLENFDEDNSIDWLPSMSVYESVIDQSNSYVSRYGVETHKIIPSIMWDKDTERGSWSLQAKIGFLPIRQKLDYQRGTVDTTIVRNTLQFTLPFAKLSYWTKEHDKGFQLVLKATPKLPDLIYMVNVEDATDPMNVKIGNSGLKNEIDYHVNMLFSLNNIAKQRNQSFRLDYTYRSNAIAMGYNYNINSGIRTYRADNVNGNWNVAATYSIEQPFGRRKKLSLTNNSTIQHINSVDMIGTSDGASDYATRNSVQTMALNEKLKLFYKISSMSQVGAKIDVEWCNIKGSSMDFDCINAVNFNYGVTASLALPWHLRLGTDLTMFSRRGYKGSSLNSDDLLWNARLSYTMCKGKLVWMFDGFDILGKLNSITRKVNAQGRIEIFRNVLPRYAILHVAYHFSMKPRK